MQQIKPDDDDTFLDNFVLDYLRKINCQDTFVSFWLEKGCSSLPPPVDSHRSSFLASWWDTHWELVKENVWKKRNFPIQAQPQHHHTLIKGRLPSSVQLGLTPILPASQQLLQSAEMGFKGYDFNAGLQIPAQNDIFLQSSLQNQQNLRENNGGNPFISNFVYHEPTCEPECQEHIKSAEEEEVPGMFCKPIMKNGKRCFEQCGVACCLDTTPDTAVDSGKSSRGSLKAKKVVVSRASNFRGVSRNGRSWQAIIMINKAKKYVGSYKSEREAAVAYDKAAILFHGDKAMTNFSYNAAEIEAIRLEKEAQDLKATSGASGMEKENNVRNMMKIEDN